MDQGASSVQGLVYASEGVGGYQRSLLCVALVSGLAHDRVGGLLQQERSTEVRSNYMLRGMEANLRWYCRERLYFATGYGLIQCVKGLMSFEDEVCQVVRR